ncbi:MAG: TauD/TfdA family dioxygenase [Acidimicrobiales bacterium]|nr:TauD/TfdA family dioxygenase [Acidimicrobiales bacterium]
MSNIDVEPLAGALGAIVWGADLDALGDAAFAEIEQAWHDHHVLFFRDQTLSPEGHLAFGRRFGELELHPLTEKLDGYPEITVLHSERGGRADVWHTDVTFAESPPVASILRHVSGPVAGGDTMWASLSLAYESMSEPLRELIDGLTAVHTAWPQGRPDLSHEHPLVRVHPVTGRRSIYVNRLFTTRIPQLQEAESTALLAHLYAWCERPEVTCRWRWRPGDVAMWDNRCTLHYALSDYDVERVMQRVTVLGDRPSGQDPRWPHRPEPRLSAASAFDRRTRTGG